MGTAEGDGGIPNGAMLVSFAEAIVGDDTSRLNAARDEVRQVLGEDGLVDCCGIAATFNAIDRVADSIGIPIDEIRLEPTAEFRRELGIDEFPSRLES
ncbi:MAG: hypothetical protein CMM52_13390 [Rhodospirillaceae bacterium]|nr:hypothetical protein [Rhodospirillaceae bacterium]|tara:strand:+ start:4247 stop:4540 length:294 start_codon:yes stop_codon:yes gene_type:complete